MARYYSNANDLITFSRLQAQNTTSGSSYLGSDGLLKFAAEDEPRIEYGSDGSLKGLLIEEQRANLITYSEDFSHSSWANDTVNMSVTPDYANSPSGTQSASRLEYSGGTSNSYFQVRPSPSSGTANATLTFSIWVSGTGSFRLKNTHGSVIDNYSSVISASTTLTRYDFTVSNGSSVGDGTQIVGIVPADDLSAFDLTVWGAQLELGSFPTSYIPTSGSQSTRSPDIASIPVSAFGYNQEAGTVVVDFDSNGSDGADYPRIFSLTNTAGTDLVRFLINPTNTTTVAVIENSLGVALNGWSGSISPNTSERIAVSMKKDSFTASLSGASTQTDTAGNMPAAADKLAIGTQANLGNNYLNGHIKSLSYFPRRLTNAQLQELTS